MNKKNIDWSNLPFSYIKTDKRYVSNFKNGEWDEGTLSDDDMILISECAGVLQVFRFQIDVSSRIQTRRLNQISTSYNLIQHIPRLIEII